MITFLLVGSMFGQTIFFTSNSQLEQYRFNYGIKGLGPTICDPSSATDGNFPGFFFEWGTFDNVITSSFLTSFLSTNLGTYHIAEAYKRDTIILDLPDILDVKMINPQVEYRYGSIQNTNLGGGFVSVDSLSPSGRINYKIPVMFNKGIEKAYLAIRFQVGPNSILGYTRNLVIVPITVAGAVLDSVQVLGTVVQPQIPYIVLHAPPGDLSTSSFINTKTTCREYSDTYAEDGSLSANAAVKIGVAGDAGFIITAPFEFSTTFTVGGTIGDVTVLTSSKQNCLTIGTGFEISGDEDVFIGYGTDVSYGIGPAFIIESSTCKNKLDTVLVYGYSNSSTVREFAYTHSRIQTELETLKVIVADSSTVGPKVANNAQNQIDVWNQVLALNDSIVNSPNNEIVEATVNFSQAIKRDKSYGISNQMTNSIEVEHYIDFSAGVEFVVEFGGSGISGGIEYKSSKRFGNSFTQSSINEQVVSYSLHDDDVGDEFNVQVVRDPVYGTHIFNILPGTKSSCPYEVGYRRDQPNVSADYNPCSFQSDSKVFYVDNVVLLTSAIFNLQLCNNSNEVRAYNVGLYENLNGADVRIANTPLNSGQVYTTESVNAGSCKNFILTIARNPALPFLGQNGYLPQYDVYNGLLIKMYPACFGESPEEEDEARFNITFGRDGDYPFGDRDCDGTLNYLDCPLDLRLNEEFGMLKGIYSAQSQIIVESGTVFSAGDTVTLNAPIVEIRENNDVPLTSLLTITQVGCQN